MKHLLAITLLISLSSLSAQSYEYTMDLDPEDTRLTIDIPLDNPPAQLDFVVGIWEGKANVKKENGKIVVGRIKLSRVGNKTGSFITTIEEQAFNKKGDFRKMWNDKFGDDIALAIVHELSFYL